MKIPPDATHQGPFTLTFFREVKISDYEWLTYEWCKSEYSWIIPMFSSKPLPEKWKLNPTGLNIFKFEGE